jgi:cytochrome c5
MLKISSAALLLAVMLPVGAPAQANMARMTQMMEQTCATQCHSMSLIAQQRLDRAGWTREVDKMIRWGAVVSAEDKEALISHLVVLFNTSRPRPNTSKVVPEGRGKDVFQVSCMSCHDDKVLVSRNLDRAGWAGVVDKMMNWGAYVPTARRDELIEYLLANFSR